MPRGVVDAVAAELSTPGERARTRRAKRVARARAAAAAAGYGTTRVKKGDSVGDARRAQEAERIAAAAADGEAEPVSIRPPPAAPAGKASGRDSASRDHSGVDGGGGSGAASNAVEAALAEALAELSSGDSDDAPEDDGARARAEAGASASQAPASLPLHAAASTPGYSRHAGDDHDGDDGGGGFDHLPTRPVLQRALTAPTDAGSRATRVVSAAQALAALRPEDRNRVLQTMMQDVSRQEKMNPQGHVSRAYACGNPRVGAKETAASRGAKTAASRPAGFTAAAEVNKSRIGVMQTPQQLLARLLHEAIRGDERKGVPALPLRMPLGGGGAVPTEADVGRAVAQSGLGDKYVPTLRRRVKRVAARRKDVKREVAAAPHRFEQLVRLEEEPDAVAAAAPAAPAPAVPVLARDTTFIDVMKRPDAGGAAAGGASAGAAGGVGGAGGGAVAADDNLDDALDELFGGSSAPAADLDSLLSSALDGL